MSTNFFKELFRKLKDKEYRDLFVAEQIYSRLPLKMHMLREQRKLTQKQFGEKAGMAQAWVSKLEDPNYGKLTISTLLKVASAHDVALVVDFVPFSKLLRDTTNLSPESFEVLSFDEDSFEEEDIGKTIVTISEGPSSFFILNEAETSGKEEGGWMSAPNIGVSVLTQTVLEADFFQESASLEPEVNISGFETPIDQGVERRAGENEQTEIFQKAA